MIVVGVDEAGRGPLAGSVVAAAVILPDTLIIEGLTDSKKLSDKKRSVLEWKIKNQAVAWAVAEASCGEIDQINILQASLLAMARAVEMMDVTPDKALIDGNRAPNLSIPSECIVKGDLTEPCISAASILAKQTRDRQMVALDSLYPQYGFAKHKAYPTAQHRQALLEFGACPAHRKTFKPVRDVLSI